MNKAEKYFYCFLFLLASLQVGVAHNPPPQTTMQIKKQMPKLRAMLKLAEKHGGLIFVYLTILK